MPPQDTAAGLNPVLPLGTGTHRTGKKTVVIGVMAFAIMNFTTVVSLRGLPAEAEYGLVSIFYFVFAAIVALIPVALIAAELAATFPQNGGIFRWVGEAFGPRWGFAAVYWQWQAWMLWLPTVLIFGSSAVAFIWWPQHFDSALAGNKLYTIAMLLVVFWATTLFTFRGMGASVRLSTLGGLFGTIIPGGILIALAALYVAMGKHIQMPLNTGFFPDFGNAGNMVLAASIFLFYAGMETQAVHVRNLKNPTRDYPLAILLATVLTVVIFVLGTLAVGVIIPHKDINLAQSLLTAYRQLWASIGLPWLGNVMAAMVAFGVLGQVSVVVAGPSVGLLSVAKAGYLPHVLQRTNSHGIPVAILLLQGVIGTALCLAFTVLPSVESTFEILGQLSNIMFLTMYLVMFVAAIRLRYTQPDKPRPFKIPGGNYGMWIVGVIGLLGSLIAGFLSFLPPRQIATGSPEIYIGLLLAGTLLEIAIPFVIFAFHKKGWKAPDSDFEPFDWQTEGRSAGQVSKGRPLVPGLAIAIPPVAVAK
ncbi:putative glutamine/gamma-aminobutyrate antiporter GadC [Acidisoma sp. L85]|uniref:putative glutamine/gamma-aminobutyrate antiporter GadC n=1 Tax=Acidisoma sp. L85 TaxID=1641850 RepID=UPI00131AACC5|nr:putative glutamine/gamma-aminobutyrate antiporter GadC [Acidisoma sp. L85]